MIEIEERSDFMDYRFKLITDSLNKLIIIVDEHYSIEFINKEPHMKILGYQEIDLIGNSLLRFIHNDDLKNFKGSLQLNDKILQIPKTIRLKDNFGNYISFRIDIRAYIGKNDTTKYMIFLKDISKYMSKKETERQLKESEEKFRSITEQLLMGIIILQDNKIRYVNKKAADMLDYSPKELLNLPPGGFINLIFPEDRKLVANQAKKRQKGAETKLTGYECRCLKKNGDVIWIQNFSKTITYNGKFADLITVIDITDKKKLEMRSQVTEQNLKHILSSVPTVIYKSSISKNLCFTFISENVKEMTGYNTDDFTSNQYFWSSKIHPEDKERILSQLKNLSKKEVLGQEYRLKLKNGTYHWIRDECKIVNNEKGKLIELIGSWSDVTLNKRIEEKVKFQAKLVEEISDAVISTNLDFNIITWNKAAELIYGWKAEEVKRKNIQEIIPVEYPYNSQDDVLRKFFEFGYWKGEVIQPRKDGKLINILTSVNIIKDINGKPIGAVAINRDITERKLVEDMLKESEEKFKSIFKNSPIGIELYDKEGNLVDVNEASMEMFGLSDKVDALGYNFFNDPNSPEIVLNNLNIGKSSRFEKIYDFDKVKSSKSYKTQKKGTIYHNVLTTPLFLEKNDHFSHFLVQVQDITQRKVSEKKLKESEEKFRTIAEQSVLGISIIQDKAIIFVNKAFSNILEYTPEEIQTWTSKDTFSIIHEEDLARVYDKIKTRKKDDLSSKLQYQCRINTKMGKIKYVEVISKPIIYRGRIATILSLIDITEKKEAEEELKEVSRMKSEFLRRASHELKTPLVSIKGYVDFLLNVQSTEFDLQTISVLDEIKGGCDRLESLIKDILETSKLESSNIELNKSLEDLSFLIRFCFKNLQGLIRARNHDIIIDIQEHMYTMFEKERMYDVIINLLSNAINYTPPNGIIKIKSEIKNNHYIIKIKDNGIGLTIEEKSRLFTKFGKIERYGQGLDVISEGSGLGLYISKKIVNLHGGKIWVESKGRNKGSTFHFSLPLIKN